MFSHAGCQDITRRAIDQGTLNYDAMINQRHLIQHVISAFEFWRAAWVVTEADQDLETVLDFLWLRSKTDIGNELNIEQK